MICTIKNCKQEATKRFSPDMDIQGIGACETHVEDVRLAYVALIQGDEDIFKSLIGEKVKKVKPVKRVSEETRPTGQESSSPISNEWEEKFEVLRGNYFNCDLQKVELYCRKCDKWFYLRKDSQKKGVAGKAKGLKLYIELLAYICVSRLRSQVLKLAQCRA